jgi:hypothetical protein
MSATACLAGLRYERHVGAFLATGVMIQQGLCYFALHSAAWTRPEPRNQHRRRRSVVDIHGPERGYQISLLETNGNQDVRPGAHAAFFSARFPDSRRRTAWLVGAAEEEDSFPLTDGGDLPADRMFFAALTFRS